MATTMTQVRDDLFQTRIDSPFPGLTTHAYLWRRPAGNVLFYSPATDADFDAIDMPRWRERPVPFAPRRGGPQPGPDRRPFRPSAACASSRTGGDRASTARVDVPVEGLRHVDANDVEVLPTPGHSPGSTCYLVTGVDGEKYLFTGDTMFPTGDGTWATFVVPGRGDAAAMRDSLKLLGTVAARHRDLQCLRRRHGDRSRRLAAMGGIIDQALASVPS